MEEDQQAELSFPEAVPRIKGEMVLHKVW